MKARSSCGEFASSWQTGAEGWVVGNPDGRLSPAGLGWAMKISVLLPALLALSLVSRAHAADTSLITSADRTFVHKVGLGGMFEVDSSKLAQEKGVSQEVKDFSANEIKDHDGVNARLKEVATAKGIAVPEQRDAKFAKMYDSLEGKSGEAFDQAYIKMMAKLHDGDEALFVKESKTTKDPDMRAFAAKSAAIVKGHIDMLHTIEAKGVK
jgi:putative membrane protein